MKLNNKGFTLLEILMTVVILGVVLAITIPFGTRYMEDARIRSEQIFIDKVNKLIDDYIALNATDFVVDKSKSFEFNKCKLTIQKNDSDNSADCAIYHASPVTIKIGEDNVTKIPFKVLIDENLIDDGDFVNPYNKETCKTSVDDKNNYIEIFQDDDKVNYFRYRLDCISEENNPLKEKKKDSNGNKTDDLRYDCSDNGEDFDKCFVYSNVSLPKVNEG